jgi:PAS domain-containing protein
MFRRFDFKIVLFFVLLTVIMTIGVIVLWEEVLRPPFYAWVEARYPGVAYAQFRWNIQQRVEHFFISVTVDALVVTLLLRIVHRQQRRLRESEERYRALFEQAKDGIGLVRLTDHGLVEDRGACLMLAAIRAELPADDAARFADVHTPIDARVHLAQQYHLAAAGDREIARAVERGPVKDRSDLAVAAVEIVPR